MIPKLLGLASTAAATLLAAGIAIGRWSQQTTSGDRETSSPRTTSISTPASAERLAALENVIARIRDRSGALGSADWEDILAATDEHTLPAAYEMLAQLPESEFRAHVRVELLRRWAKHDPLSAAKTLVDCTDNNERALASQAVALVWIRTDCHAALEWWAAQPTPRVRPWEIAQALSRADAPDPHRVLAATEALPACVVRDLVREAAFNRLATTSPADALAFAENQPAGATRDDMRRSALTELAAQDAASAIDRSHSLADEDRQAVIVAAATGAAARDPLEALPLLDLLPAGRARLEAAEAIGEALLKEDPSLAFEFASSFPAGETQTRLLAKIGRGYAKQDPRAALQWLRTLPEGMARRTLVEHGWSALVRDERITPGEAARLAIDLVAEGERASAVTAAVDRLSASDTTVACNWVQQLSDPEARTGGLRALARNWSASAAPGALAFAQTLTADERNAFLATFGNALANRGPETAAMQIRQLPPGADRDAFIRGTVERLSYSSPRAAAGFLDAMGVGTAKNAAAAQVVQRWAAENPTAAAEWVRERPDLLADCATCSAVARNWAGWDAAGATQWLTQLPASPARAAAAAALIQATQSAAPDIAAKWLHEIADPQEREQATIGLANQWLRNDRANACAWLARCDLPRETVDALLAGRLAASEGEDTVFLTPFHVDCFD